MAFGPGSGPVRPRASRITAFALLALLGQGCTPAAPPLPPARLSGGAFPGVVGHGAQTVGGRGGRIIAVTTLEDAGPGSLRACIDESGPRICVFRVAGVIRFTQRPPIIRNPFITIAGQTAPGGGILLTHSGDTLGRTPLVVKDTHDVIVRDIRVRPDRIGEPRGSNSAYTIESSRNVVLDHVSGSWAIDENVGGYAGNDAVTISNSIFAEGVPRHDKCALLSSDPIGPQRLSFIGNLCAHNGDRNPDINFPPGSCVEVVNNVLYNGRIEFAEVWGSYGGTPVSIVGNWFRAGPNTASVASAVTRQIIGAKGMPRIYLAGNELDGIAGLETPNVAEATVAAPPCPLTVQPQSAADAYRDVLAQAGAFPRDAVDLRIVSEVRARSGRIVSEPGTLPMIEEGTPYADGDSDGMSDKWEREHGADPDRSDAWGDADGDGWSNLDAFLDFALAELMAGRTVR